MERFPLADEFAGRWDDDPANRDDDEDDGVEEAAASFPSRREEDACFASPAFASICDARFRVVLFGDVGNELKWNEIWRTTPS